MLLYYYKPIQIINISISRYSYFHGYMKVNDEIWLINKQIKYTGQDKNMLHKLTSAAALETGLMRLTLKQKQFIYQIARLEYRIYAALIKLENVNALIEEEKENITSLNAAISASGKGKVADKLIAWKTKAEYKLFKFNLRKSKIDIIKLVLNQSKKEQLKQALSALEIDLAEIKSQEQNFNKVAEENKIETAKESVFNFYEKIKLEQEENPINKSIKAYLKENMKMAC